MKHVHFIGIGGSGANAAAGIASEFGYKITGCDLKESVYGQNLRRLGISVEIGHSPEHLKDVDIVCVSPALNEQKDKPEEYQVATREHCVMAWQEFTGKELQKGKTVIGITGTKGKSTTTTFVGRAMEEWDCDPTVLVGADVKEWKQNFRTGNSEYFVCEADEFAGNFLHYRCSVLVITNITYDHPEYFKSFEEYLEAYVECIKRMPADGILVLGTDSEGVRELRRRIGFFHGRIISFGTESDADYCVCQIEADATSHKTSFVVKAMSYVSNYIPGGLMSFDTGTTTRLYELEMIGVHLVMNALPVVILGDLLKIDSETVGASLRRLCQPGRRMEYMGNYNGAEVYDDYAHSPVSVAATLESVRLAFPEKKIVAVFQPHMYSRTLALMADFPEAFRTADIVILLPIYASREQGSPLAQQVSSYEIMKEIQMNDSDKAVQLAKSIEHAVEVVQHVSDRDVIVVNMGAGDNYKVVRQLLGKE